MPRAMVATDNLAMHHSMLVTDTVMTRFVHVVTIHQRPALAVSHHLPVAHSPTQARHPLGRMPRPVMRGPVMPMRGPVTRM